VGRGRGGGGGRGGGKGIEEDGTTKPESDVILRPNCLGKEKPQQEIIMKLERQFVICEPKKTMSSRTEDRRDIRDFRKTPPGST